MSGFVRMMFASSATSPRCSRPRVAVGARTESMIISNISERSSEVQVQHIVNKLGRSPLQGLEPTTARQEDELDETSMRGIRYVCKLMRDRDAYIHYT